MPAIVQGPMLSIVDQKYHLRCYSPGRSLFYYKDKTYLPEDFGEL